MIQLPLGLPFPDDNVSEKEKLDPDFGKNCGRALWSRYCANGTYFGYASLSTLNEVRNYGNGDQSTEKYINGMTNGAPIGSGKKRGQNNSSGSPNLGDMNKFQRAGLANISYEVFSPLPKLSNVLLAIMSENDYKVDCVSLDKSVTDQKQYRKAEILVKSKLVNPLAQKLGMPTMKVPFTPRDESQLEMMDKLGFFKAKRETALEQLAELSFRSSKWSDLRRKLNKDAIDFHFRCVKLYNDDHTGQVKIKYVDPTKLVMIWDEDYEHDPTVIGHIELKQISSIYPKLKEAGFEDDQISAMAKQWLPFYGNNSGFQTWWFQRKDVNTDRWKWLDFQVPVLEFSYLSTDYKQYEDYEKDGERIYKKKETIDKKNPKKQKYDNYKCNYWYQGCYIVGGIGTDMIYDWHKVPNQMQKGLTPKCPYVFDRILGKSPTQRVMALCDDLMFAVCKLRAAVWAAAPKGYTIDVGNATNIQIGEHTYNLFDLMHIRRQNGIRVIKTQYNAQNQKYTAVALNDDDNGLGPQGLEWVAQIANIQNMIMDAMGIPAAMAAQPDQSGERLPGVMEMDYNAGNMANWPLKESEREFKARIAERVDLQTRVDIEYDPNIRGFYEMSMGPEMVKAVMEMGNLSLDDMAMSMKALPTEKEKDAIMMSAIEMSKIATRDGSVLLKPSSVEHVRQLLKNDQIDEARWFMAEEEMASKQAEQENASAMAEQTIKGQQESALVSEQAKQQTIQLQGQVDAQTAEASEVAKRTTLQLEYSLKERLAMIEINQKADREDRQIVLEGATEQATGTQVKNPKNQN